MATKLLVVVDPDRDDQPAVGRALEIAEHIDVSLHIALFGNPSVSDKLTESVDMDLDPSDRGDITKIREAWLDKIAAPARERGIKVTWEVRDFTKLYETIIQVALEADADVVLKPTRHHSILRRVLFNSTDWNLIRLCPLPLLLINDSHAVHGRDVIAAVDLVTDDDDHAELNRLLLSQAVLISRLIHAEVKIVTAVPARQGILPFADKQGPGGSRLKAVISDYRSAAEELANHFKIPTGNILIIEGRPEDVVNQLAEKLHASTIILGTVARAGLAGLFVGNTAERVLESSITDVLVVKQADFRSPIQMEDHADSAHHGRREVL